MSDSQIFPDEMEEIINTALESSTLERELAIEGAVDHIACLGTFVGLANRQAWFTSPEYFHVEQDHEKYARALRYLELLGLVERHPQHPDWVLIKQETDG